MDEQTPSHDPKTDDESLADRVSSLESRIARLEKEMESIAKMENALSHIFGEKQKEES